MYLIISVIKKLVRKILTFFIIIILGLISLIIIFFNIKKIINTDVIIIQNIRIGFGNIFTSIDLSRKMFSNKRILIIHFFDSARYHNKKIFDFLGQEKIILYTSVHVNFLKKRLGEFEIQNMKKNILQNFLINLTKNLSKKKCRIFNIPELYNLASDKAKKLKLKKYKFKSLEHKWITYYYYLFEKNPILEIDKNQKTLKTLIKSKAKNTICFYKREKGMINSMTKKYKLFYTLIKFFHKKNYQIYLTGEYSNLVKKFYKIKSMVELPEVNKIFNPETNLAMQLVSDYYIGDSGGGSYFGMYKQKPIILGGAYGNSYPKKIKNFEYRFYYKNRDVLKNFDLKRKVNKLLVTQKTMMDPYVAYKNGFSLKEFNDAKVIKYVQKKFKAL